LSHFSEDRSTEKSQEVGFLNHIPQQEAVFHVLGEGFAKSELLCVPGSLDLPWQGK
jgi:hypothetical protein